MSVFTTLKLLNYIAVGLLHVFILFISQREKACVIYLKPHNRNCYYKKESLSSKWTCHVRKLVTPLRWLCMPCIVSKTSSVLLGSHRLRNAPLYIILIVGTKLEFLHCGMSRDSVETSRLRRMFKSNIQCVAYCLKYVYAHIITCSYSVCMRTKKIKNSAWISNTCTFSYILVLKMQSASNFL